MPSANPLVSVIIPVHNGERYLAEALQSVLVQTYSPYEIWVVNNGSTDGTAAVARAFPAVNYIEAPYADATHARRQGANVAQGELLAFLDHDDTWVSTKLAEQVQFLQNHPQCGGVLGLQHIYLQEGCLKPHWLKQEYLEAPQYAYLPSALMVRKSLFSKLDETAQHFPHASDVAWFFNAKRLGIAIEHIPRVLIHRRVHQSNSSGYVVGVQQDILGIIHSSLRAQRENRRQGISS